MKLLRPQAVIPLSPLYHQLAARMAGHHDPAPISAAPTEVKIG